MSTARRRRGACYGQIVQPSPLTSPRRAGRLALVAVAVVALLVLAERGLRGVVAPVVLPTGPAEWIWASDTFGRSDPLAFYAARDFELDRVPAEARLLALADEEHVLHLNGQRVGSDAYEPGAPLAVWRVEGLLQPGWNRLLVELRSSRAAGGFLALLTGDAGEPLVWTDERWLVFPRHETDLVRGSGPLAGGAPAFSWGLPPAGRWNVPRPGPERPLWRDLMPGGRPAPVKPMAVRSIGARARSRGETAAVPAAGFAPQVLFDFGREVEGYLALEHLSIDEEIPGLLFTGLKPPHPRQRRPQEAVVCMPGRRLWLDARPRRFRYALVLGMERLTGARLYPVRPEAAASLLPGAQPPAGVFGLEPPPLSTPIEDRVWKSLRRGS